MSTFNRGARGGRRERSALRALRPLRLCLFAIVASPAAAQPPPLTFTKDIAPVVWARCATCHRPGEIGPFSLITYDDVRRHATQIAAVTARRVMPPWKPAPGRGSFQNERRLSDAELDAIQKWIAGGAPEGEAADLPALPLPLREAQRERAWQLGTPDLIVTMPAPYTLAADGADVFRTFVIPIPVAAARYVRALGVHAGNAGGVPHA